ncbi:MAG: acyl-CoA thioesterase [Gemmatimonadetes bacterium]|nr:MAG: acyl-CoA thioesterase [Gemmatimonadota bacterium]
MYIYHTSIKLHDTDAAGLLFFANQFKLAHDAYETFFNALGFNLGKMIQSGTFVLPIVHADADFTAPLFVGDRVGIRIHLGKVGRSSFTLLYDILRETGETVGRVKTVHVAIDKQTREKIELPERLKMALMTGGESLPE